MLSNYVGELSQHDSSNHVWAPLAGTNWYLITTLDDYSRYILYGDLWERESSWVHILAAKSVATGFGCPISYYVDRHSIFKYIKKRDSIYKKYYTSEEEAFVQWKEVLKDINIKTIYALSAQAKGKIERPYGWLQDHLVRTCVREKIDKIEQAREVLYEELHNYNYRWVHSTTQEIPIVRFERAVKEKRSLFRPLQIRQPYKSFDDIFCYRFKRIVDPYRRLSFNTLKFSISGAPIGSEVEMRISFDLKNKTAKIRFWYQGKLLDEKMVKAQDLKKVQF